MKDFFFFYYCFQLNHLCPLTRSWDRSALPLYKYWKGLSIEIGVAFSGDAHALVGIQFSGLCHFVRKYAAGGWIDRCFQCTYHSLGGSLLSPLLTVWGRCPGAQLLLRRTLGVFKYCKNTRSHTAPNVQSSADVCIWFWCRYCWFNNSIM